MCIRAYKFRLYPSKKQENELNRHLFIAKELWNTLLQKEKEYYEKEKKFYTKTELQKMTKQSELYSQTAQAVCHRLHNAIYKMIQERKRGRNIGFPRFKNFFRMRSLYYPQSGFRLEKRLEASPFGGISIKKHREIKGEIKTLALKKSQSGKWSAIFCADIPNPKKRINNGEEAGVDLGLMNFAALSNGEIIANPRHFRKYEEKLASAQREFSRKEKRSRNRNKQRVKIAGIHEKIADARADFLHKTTNKLLSNYSLIAMEKLASQDMAMQGHGKGINDAGWRMFANMLAYKAENAGCKVIFVDPKNTSKECSGCGQLVEKTLWERQHNCPSCGLSIDRDVNAAINILKRATEGNSESNACGDGAAAPSIEAGSPAL